MPKLMLSAFISIEGPLEMPLSCYTPDRFPHRRLDRQIEKMIQRLFTKAIK
jgi:hypothetical protein